MPWCVLSQKREIVTRKLSDHSCQHGECCAMKELDCDPFYRSNHVINEGKTPHSTFVQHKRRWRRLSQTLISNKSLRLPLLHRLRFSWAPRRMNTSAGQGHGSPCPLVVGSKSLKPQMISVIPEKIKKFQTWSSEAITTFYHNTSVYDGFLSRYSSNNAPDNKPVKPTSPFLHWSVRWSKLPEKTHDE